MAENNFCRNCGTAMQNGVCPKCGTGNNAAPAQTYAQANSVGYAGNGYAGNTYAGNDYAVDNLDYSRLFTSSKERYVASLGNGYLANFLTSGSIGNGFAVVSDKRVYFRGNMININGKRLMHRQTSKVVDLKDVTGTGVQTFRNIMPTIIAGGVGLFLSIMFIILGATSSGYLSERESFLSTGAFLFSLQL